MLKIMLAGALVAIATPAVAQDRAHNPLQVSDALKAGCEVQQTHLPAGKSGTGPAIVRCPADAERQAAKAEPAAAQSTALAAREVSKPHSVD